jgi:hypothetical protein
MNLGSLYLAALLAVLLVGAVPFAYADALPEPTDPTPPAPVNPLPEPPIDKPIPPAPPDLPDKPPLDNTTPKEPPVKPPLTEKPPLGQSNDSTPLLVGGAIVAVIAVGAFLMLTRVKKK